MEREVYLGILYNVVCLKCFFTSSDVAYWYIYQYTWCFRFDSYYCCICNDDFDVFISEECGKVENLSIIAVG